MRTSSKHFFKTFKRIYSQFFHRDRIFITTSIRNHHCFQISLEKRRLFAIIEMKNEIKMNYAIAHAESFSLSLASNNDNVKTETIVSFITHLH